MNDDELKALLQIWEAPPAPGSLRNRVVKRKLKPWRWLLSGEVRVPVPVAIALLCLVGFALYTLVKPPGPTLSDFEPIQEFKPRIVRTAR